MNLLSKARVALVAGLLLAGGVAAYSAMWTGLPPATSSPTTVSGNAATLPLTGAETGAFDTGLSGGRNPQTETISVDQLKTYMYGNSGTASATINTVAAATGATTAGAATCNASRCVINSAAMTLAAGATHVLTVSNSVILSTSILLVTVGNITNTSTGSLVFSVIPYNLGGAGYISLVNNGIAFNGTVRWNVVVIN